MSSQSLDIRDATTSTPGTLNDLTTDLIMANNNNNHDFYKGLKQDGNVRDALAKPDATEDDEIVE